MVADDAFEIRPETSMLGPRWVVYEGNKRRANCPSESRAKQVIEELRAKRGSR